MLRLGVDLGSTTVKAVLIDEAGHVVQSGLRAGGANPAEEILILLAQLCPSGLPERVCATGYGRARAGFANRKVTEITCHAAGVCAAHPLARTILDIGGQDSKAIRLDENGNVADFAMNDKCAAGTGSFLDAIARKLNFSPDDLARLHERNPRPLPVSATCAVFAESEAVGLLAAGEKAEDILAGIHAAVAARVARLYTQVGGLEPIFLTGGGARNDTLRLALEHELGCTVTAARAPQLMGAFGAALLA